MSLSPSRFHPAAYAAVMDTTSEPDASALVRAILFGLVGAVAGAFGYAKFISVTHIQIGYLSIGVAFLVATAMLKGSRGRGGIDFQVAAVMLTYLAVTAGNSLLMVWAMQDRGIPLRGSLVGIIAFGFERPFLRFLISPVGGALGLFILFVGLRGAWRMTSGLPGASDNPFRRFAK